MKNENKVNNWLKWIKQFELARTDNFKSSDREINAWIQNQRGYYRKGKMLMWKAEFLDNAGFIWDPKQGVVNKEQPVIIKLKIVDGKAILLK